MQATSIMPMNVKVLNPKAPTLNRSESLPSSFIQEASPSEAKLSPETAAGSLSPITSLDESTLDSPNPNQKPADPSAKPGFLMNTLRKFKMGNESPIPHTPQSRMVLNRNKDKVRCLIPEIKKVNVHRVNFAPETFKEDPPQQIPARLPKSGTVQVNDEGVIIRPNHLGDAINPGKSYYAATQAATAAAYNSATLIASIVKGEHKKSHSRSSKFAHDSLQNEKAEEEEEDVMDGIAVDGIKSIDTPMHGASALGSSGSSTPTSTSETKPTKSGLTELYTRCCHLREIMPIQATLSQLEGRTDTLPYLRLMNPRPTLIEVLAFSDFISIVPINTIVFNNMDITEEMFKNLILSLTRTTSLFKLSLKNVNITPNNWKILCAFLAVNKSLVKLDISVAEPRDGKKKIKYKQQPYFDRSELNWSLLTKTLIYRGGIEELIISGCLVPHEEFGELISKACSIATKRLGVASSDLQESDLTALSNWTTQTHCVCEGIDLGGNDLSHSTELVTKLFLEASVLYVSLNSCKLSDAEGLDKIFEHNHSHSKIRFLDMSFNPDLFPKFVSTIEKYIPKYKFMKRIHLDYNNLRSQDIITLAEVFAKCPSLSHISLLGNRDINDAAAESLAVAVKLSSTITLVDIDTDLIPTTISRRLSHYCMQNMEDMIDPQKVDEANNLLAEYNFDDETELLDDGNELVKAVKYVVDTNKQDEPTEQADRCQLVTDGLARRAKSVRGKVRTRLETIMKKTDWQEMTQDFRDKFMKLYYLDATLERVLEKYDALNEKYYSRSFGMYYPPTLNPHRAVEPRQEGINVPDKRSAGNEDKFESMSPPSNSGVQTFRAEPPSTNTSEHMRKLEKEEGDFHKFGVFIRHNKSTQTLTHPLNASGSQLRKLILSESGGSGGAAADAETTEPEVSTSTKMTEDTPRPSDSKSDTSTGTTPSTSTNTTTTTATDEDGEHDVENLIAKLKGMSDIEVQDYFKKVYGSELPIDDEEEDGDTSTEEGSEEASEEGSEEEKRTGVSEEEVKPKQTV